jgi:hypothetical protein
MTLLLVVAALALGILAFGKSISGALSASTDGSVQKIAQAIAIAEGFYVNGSRPQRNHNPGDMTQDLIGKSVGTDGAFVVYASDDDGWANLYKQIQMWLDGSSSHADASFTISDISHFYTTTDQTAWATNVANHLGVGLDTPIGEIS